MQAIAVNSGVATEIRSGQWAIHGGRLDTAQVAYADAPQPWLDLSTGINPVPWKGLDLASVDLGALPDVSALVALEAAAAAMFGIGEASIAALPGSEMGLRLLDTIGLPAPHHVLTPGYRTHATAFADARPVGFDDLDVVAGAGGTLLLANPGNPEGRVMTTAALLDLADLLAARAGWLVVDEAFADAVSAASIAPALGAPPNILILRSFGKFFGLAGVRLGFVAGAPMMVERIRSRLGSWPVSSLAIAVGTAAYRDRDWIENTRAWLTQRVAALDRTLAGHGLEARGACPLFRLVETPRAAQLFDRLAQAGILTRPFDHAPTWLRFGLPADAAALARLDRALADG